MGGVCFIRENRALEAMLLMLLAHRLYPNDCEIYRVLCEVFTSLPASFLQGEGSNTNLAEIVVEEMLECFPQR